MKPVDLEERLGARWDSDAEEVVEILIDLWAAAIEMRAERMRSFPGAGEAKVHDALKKLEAW